MDTSPEVYRLFDRVTAGVPGPVSLSAVYADLRWPVARSADRPYVAMNMVTTLDGKVVVGGTGTTKLIGSDIDHALMERGSTCKPMPFSVAPARYGRTGCAIPKLRPRPSGNDGSGACVRNHCG